MKSGDKPAEPPISIVVFDATGITADLLKRAFSKQPGFEVVGCPKVLEEGIRTVLETQADIVIISAFEQTASAAVIEFLNELSSRDSSTRAIILSSNLTDDQSVAYFQGQARGVLSGSSADFALLCKCVTCVHAGQIWASSEQLVRLIESLSPARKLSIVNDHGMPILSAREEEVLQLLAEGLSNRELATALKLSEHTVRNHLFHIFDKLGVSSRMEAVVYALNHIKRQTQSSSKAPRFANEIPLQRRNSAIAVNE